MSNEITLPDYLKKMVDGGSVDSAGLVSATSSVPRISLKGRQFRFIEGGEEVKKEAGPIYVIFLGAQPENGMSKTWYEGSYNPNDSGPPSCSSSDGVHPDSWVSNPQAESCSACEKNKWGSATSLAGKKAKACRDSKRIMVVEPDDIEGGTIYILNVTISSLKALSEYGRMLNANSVPMAAAITKLSMVDSDFPQLEFEFAGCLKEENGIKAMERSTKREWDSFDSKPKLENQSKPQLTQDTPVAEEKSAAPAKPADVDDILNKW